VSQADALRKLICEIDEGAETIAYVCAALHNGLLILADARRLLVAGSFITSAIRELRFGVRGPERPRPNVRRPIDDEPAFGA
jgi:hypothetical protein